MCENTVVAVEPPNGPLHRGDSVIAKNKGSSGSRKALPAKKAQTQLRKTKKQPKPKPAKSGGITSVAHSPAVPWNVPYETIRALSGPALKETMRELIAAEAYVSGNVGTPSGDVPSVVEKRWRVQRSYATSSS
jgi:hypothetical protein